MEGIRSEWTTLWDRCPSATPFQIPEWLCTWWKHFGNDNPMVITLRRNGKLCGLAPLFVYRHQDGTRRVAFIGSGISDYLDILVDPDETVAAQNAFLQHLVRRSDAWDICELEELRAGSPLLGKIRVPGLELRTEHRNVSGCLLLPGSVAEFRANLTARFRKRLRYGQNCLLREGGLRLETADTKSRPEFLEALFRLHRASWERKDLSGVLAEHAIREFHREASSALLDRGMLRLMVLRLKEKIIAGLYCFAAKGRLYCYLSGFDPDAARFSPGRHILWFAIENAIGERIREFDFLRGEEEYKLIWGPRLSYNFRLQIRHAA